MANNKQALDGARLTAFGKAPEELFIVTDPKDALYDERVKLPLSEALVANIMAKGVIEPVIVRKRGDDAVVIDGRQRVRAAIEANKRLKSEGAPLISVPVMIRRGDETDAVEVMIGLNEIRQDDSLLVRARKAQRLAQLGRGDVEIALVFGVTVQTVKTWEKLLGLPATVQHAVERGEITVAMAVNEIGKLPADKQAEAAAKAPKTTAKDRKQAGGRKAAATRATKTTLRKVAESDALNGREKALAGFFLGTVGKGDLLTKIPALKSAVS